ncbi:hypothetical protein NIES4071_75940 [Calothrix sp. NIES-4071]|nr:hypothetical protein NIES4071_75940 [Calothrix sp. NIES-4071]BAZ61869.1 hypothetical protein NIES4105_75890 [Calothrix sp. NIES-4105]
MQEVLKLIESNKQKFATLPLFEYMYDCKIEPKQRLAFAPCMSHFIMSFTDFNKYVFRAENCQSNRKVQEMINEHTKEDESHSPWFLVDLELLKLNPIKSFTDVLEFLWGEETKITRQITYQVAGLTLQAEPIVKLAAIEALEAMGNVFFTASSKVTSELRSITQKEYAYFGESHLEVETGHTMGTSEVESCFAKIKLTEEQQKQASYVVEAIFKIFSEWTYELLTYAHNHPIEFVNIKNSNLVLIACK